MRLPNQPRAQNREPTQVSVQFRLPQAKNSQASAMNSSRVHDREFSYVSVIKSQGSGQLHRCSSVPPVLDDAMGGNSMGVVAAQDPQLVAE